MLLTTTTQDPVSLHHMKDSYFEVRKMQLKAKEKNPFSMPFLYWMYQKFMEDVFSRLSKKDAQRVDCLLMLITYTHRADENKLTGMDVENLYAILGQISHLMEWE